MKQNPNKIKDLNIAALTQDIQLKELIQRIYNSLKRKGVPEKDAVKTAYKTYLDAIESDIKLGAYKTRNKKQDETESSSSELKRIEIPLDIEKQDINLQKLKEISQTAKYKVNYAAIEKNYYNNNEKSEKTGQIKSISINENNGTYYLTAMIKYNGNDQVATELIQNYLNQLYKVINHLNREEEIKNIILQKYLNGENLSKDEIKIIEPILNELSKRKGERQIGD